MFPRRGEGGNVMEPLLKAENLKNIFQHHADSFMQLIMSAFRFRKDRH